MCNWENNKEGWNAYKINFSQIFLKLKESKRSTERFRDLIRKKLHKHNEILFPWGQKYAAVNDVLNALLASTSPLTTKSTSCTICNHTLADYIMTSHVDAPNERGDFDIYLDIHKYDMSVKNWLLYYFNSVRTKCISCQIQILDESYPDINIYTMPPLISVKLYTTYIKLDPLIMLQDNEDHQHAYILQGIVYFGGAHFVSRIIDTNYDVWYNDGITTQRRYIKEKPFREFSNSDLHSLSIGQATFHSCFVVYRKN